MDLHLSPALEEKLKALSASTGRLPEEVVEDAVRNYQTSKLAALDWSRCAAVERSPERVSGAWVLRGTRMPVATIFENLEAGASLDDIMTWYDGLDREPNIPRGVGHHAPSNRAADASPEQHLSGLSI